AAQRQRTLHRTLRGIARRGVTLGPSYGVAATSIKHRGRPSDLRRPVTGPEWSAAGAARRAWPSDLVAGAAFAGWPGLRQDAGFPEPTRTVRGSVPGPPDTAMRRA